MKRAFISLYLVLVLSILGLGWGMDYLWSSFRPAGSAPLPSVGVLNLVELAIEQRDLDKARALVTDINEARLAELELLTMDQVGGLNSVKRLQAGEPLAFEDDNGNRFLYHKVPNRPWVLVAAENTPRPRWFETGLAALFYTTLGLAVFIWLWPLSRDLDKLKRHAQTLGTDQRYPEVSVPPSSTVHSLARAFNRMTRRIHELLQTQKEMTHAVSHELRTPLARMKFALEMAEDDQSADDIKNKLEGMRADVTEMDQLINQLLHYARFDQLHPELNEKAGDMPSLAEDVVQRLTSLSEQPPEVSIDTNLNQPFICDWPLMERALLNLVQNALHYSHRRVAIHLHSDEDEYRITVEDDGPGVAPDAREKVFESFVRLRQNPDKHAAGFGVGLAIVRRVAHWHKGQARVETASLGGARFVIRWPSAKAQPNLSA